MRDDNGDPDEGRVRELLSVGCSVDGFARHMLRLPDWLAVYVTRQLCVMNMTGGGIAEFMVCSDDDVHDELKLERAWR